MRPPAGGRNHIPDGRLRNLRCRVYPIRTHSTQLALEVVDVDFLRLTLQPIVAPTLLKIGPNPLTARASPIYWVIR